MRRRHTLQLDRNEFCLRLPGCQETCLCFVEPSAPKCQKCGAEIKWDDLRRQYQTCACGLTKIRLAKDMDGIGKAGDLVLLDLTLPGPESNALDSK